MITKINSASLSSKASIQSKGKKQRRTRSKHGSIKQLPDIDSASSSVMEKSAETGIKGTLTLSFSINTSFKILR